LQAEQIHGGRLNTSTKIFALFSGYTPEELLHKPHSMIRHPDMPGVIFKMMWERLKNNQDIFTVVKNVAKNGDYYWVTTQF
jgi:PAS domain S-box-containing protein